MISKIIHKIKRKITNNKKKKFNKKITMISFKIVQKSKSQKMNQ